jgi:molybdopterin molybdotransferase
MIEIQEAVNIVLDAAGFAGAEEVGPLDALGRILAQDVSADSDVPYSDNSAMDGYAVRAEDVRGAAEEKPVELEVIEDIPAGRVPAREVAPGTASRIMTGAPIPDGADAVVMVEHTEKRGGKVLIKASVPAGANIRKAGEDIKKGQLLFSPGIALRAADIGVLVSAGLAKIAVGRRPVVGIISTGDEIVAPGEPAGRGRVRNSNSYALFALCRAAGADPKYLGIVPDRKEDIRTAFRAASESCDAIVASGGVSAGDYDFVKETIGEMGDIKFWKVRMKPGKPLAFGRMGAAPLFGLPGNPVSVMVGFELFIRPAILKMMGARDIFRARTSARLEHEIAEKPSRTKIFRGIATRSGEKLTVKSTGGQGSGILMSMVLANCFFIMPEGISKLKKGDSVEVIPLDNFPV